MASLAEAGKNESVPASGVTPILVPMPDGTVRVSEAGHNLAEAGRNLALR